MGAGGLRDLGPVEVLSWFAAYIPYPHRPTTTPPAPLPSETNTVRIPTPTCTPGPARAYLPRLYCTASLRNMASRCLDTPLLLARSLETPRPSPHTSARRSYPHPPATALGATPALARALGDGLPALLLRGAGLLARLRVVVDRQLRARGNVLCGHEREVRLVELCVWAGGISACLRGQCMVLEMSSWYSNLPRGWCPRLRGRPSCWAHTSGCGVHAQSMNA